MRLREIAIAALLISFSLSTARAAPTPMDIHAAVRAGDVEQVDAALKSGAGLNSPDNWGRTPLIVALQQGKAPVVEMLIDRGASVAATDAWGRTPLLVATQLKNTAGHPPLAGKEIGCERRQQERHHAADLGGPDRQPGSGRDVVASGCGARPGGQPRLDRLDVGRVSERRRHREAAARQRRRRRQGRKGQVHGARNRQKPRRRCCAHCPRWQRRPHPDLPLRRQ